MTSNLIPYYSYNDSIILTGVYLQSQANDTGNESNLYINNSVKIPYTHQGNYMDNIYHSNAAIWLKDSALSGKDAKNTITWQKIQAYENDLTFNDSIIITEYNAPTILSNVYINYPFDASNIIVTGNHTNNAYVNFTNGTNKNQGPTGVGFRFSNTSGKLQFSNNGAAWFDITSANQTLLEDLEDVHVANKFNRQYLVWDAGTQYWINSNLALADDPNPTLSSNLNMNGYGLISDNLAVYNTSGNVVVDMTSVGPLASNYLSIVNSNSGADPTITPAGTDLNIGITLNTKNEGNLVLNTNPGGNVFINTNVLEVSGIIKNSIYRTSTRPEGFNTNPPTSWTIPISSDTVLFDFNSSNTGGPYWANVGAGIEGQKLNLVMNCIDVSNITVWADFGNNGLGTGNGLATRMKFNKSGQGASLIYLGPPQNIWQILNTGAQTY